MLITAFTAPSDDKEFSLDRHDLSLLTVMMNQNLTVCLNLG